MIGYTIGLVLGLSVFIVQNLKPTSMWFRVLFLLLSIAFLWGVSYCHAGYWNMLIIPIGELFLCFIAAFVFPYESKSAQKEYMKINGINYYGKFHEKDIIGDIKPPGFKQTYDRIIEGVLFDVFCDKVDFVSLKNLLYSKNFYPISIHTKEEVLQHIYSVVDEVVLSSKYNNGIRLKTERNIELLFNAYISVMSIHEDATNAINNVKDYNL